MLMHRPPSSSPEIVEQSLMKPKEWVRSMARKSVRAFDPGAYHPMVYEADELEYRRALDALRRIGFGPLNSIMPDLQRALGALNDLEHYVRILAHYADRDSAIQARHRRIVKNFSFIQAALRLIGSEWED
jgi:hypothetical protein